MAMWRGVALGFAMWAVSAAAFAADAPGSYALRLDGEPKYGPGFTHFDYVNPDAPKGGEMRLSGFGGFDNLNPFILRGIPALGAGLVFSTLTESSSDEYQAEYGSLAQTIALAPDKTWVEYALRPDAKFSDGTPVTAEDVLWSFETLKEKGHPIYRTYYADVVKAEAAGEWAVRFTFRNITNKELPLIMGQLPVLPKHAFEGKEFDQTTMEPLIGSGPYKVEAIDPGRSITYVRVKDWWGENLPVNKGHYNFDRIRYDYYRDLDVMFEAFKAGAYDFRLERSAKSWTTGYDFPALKDGAVVKEEIKSEDPEGMQAFVLNIRRPVFADRRVREGINLLFDFEWTRKTLFYGLYRRTTSFFANSELAAAGPPGPEELKILEPYRGKIPDEVYSKPFELPVTDGSGNIRTQLRAALGLFKLAGWEVKDNKLVNAAGERMKFEILLVQANFERVVQPFIRNLERAGIETSIRIVDAAQYTNRVDGFDYDMIVSSFLQSLSPGNEQRDFWNSERADLPGSRNLIGIKDPVVDDLIEKLINAPDRASLVAHTKALDRVLLWNWYVIPQWYDDQVRVAYWNRFGHPATPPKYNGPLAATTWWFDAAKDAALPANLRRGVQ
jgi:microcin C transport system substrate-binding protein